ncbi:MAG TPA: PHP domain-containing protein [Candidatus Methylacidiphilales bacterium]|nr:PHP domain-containing protein [Candidatus Methylacidiphilales bacterium]
MTLPIDYHNHPQAHSVKPYSAALLQPWADAARARGLKEVAFTDHDRYLEGVDFGEIDRLREANPSLKFLAGIELDNDPVSGRAGRLWVETNWEQLDFVLGSVHYLPGETEMFDQVTRKDEFAKRDMPAECAKYVREVEGMIERGGIDTLAHLDLIKIHGVWHPEGGLRPHFISLLELIQRKGLSIEISTAGWRKPVGEQYPHVDLIREAQRLGIPFTLASDAHSHAQLAENYDRLAELLAGLGIREVAAYEKHRRRMIPI